MWKNLVRIKEPIWSTKSVGIAEEIILRASETHVEILYENIRGWRLWPNEYVISKEKALKYPVKMVKGRTLRIIPIAALTEIKEDECQEQQLAQCQESKSTTPPAEEPEGPSQPRLF
jgi:hypothetical protein